MKKGFIGTWKIKAEGEDFIKVEEIEGKIFVSSLLPEGIVATTTDVRDMEDLLVVSFRRTVESLETDLRLYLTINEKDELNIKEVWLLPQTLMKKQVDNQGEKVEN